MLRADIGNELHAIRMKVERDWDAARTVLGVSDLVNNLSATIRELYALEVRIETEGIAE